MEPKIATFMSVILFSSCLSPEKTFEVGFFYKDAMSTWMCNLSMILTALALSIYCKKMGKSKLLLISTSGLIAFIFFITNNLMFFFVLFESSLIPLVMIILGWGNQPERVKASKYIMIYTLVSSIPFLIFMIYLCESEGIFCMNSPINQSNYSNIWLGVEFLSTVSLFLAFLMKIPIFFLHSWLPKAHVEAPLEGSIILAGIMLKVGTFGMMRMILMFQSSMIYKIQTFIFCLSIFGSIVSIMMAVSSDDLKLSIALSSVSHMNFLISSMISMKDLSVFSTNCIMISHGFTSSILFFFVTVLYEMNSSRSILMVKGSASTIPSVNLFSFIFFSMSISIPPSLPFLGEILSISIIMNLSWEMISMIIMFILFNSFFSMNLFGMLNQSSKTKKPIPSNTKSSFFLFSSFLTVLMVETFFFPEMIM